VDSEQLIGKYEEVCGIGLFYGNNVTAAGRTDENPQSCYRILFVG